jgi:hypothetical protein
MNTVLDICKITQGKYKFTVRFENNEDKATEIAIDRLENSAENVGFHFENNGKRLDPVSYRIISKKCYRSNIVKPKECISIEFTGTLEKRQEKYHFLVFKNASYQITLGKKYTVWFSLNGYKSKPIDMIFTLDL